VNHRIFERKLRSRYPREHVRLSAVSNHTHTLLLVCCWLGRASPPASSNSRSSGSHLLYIILYILHDVALDPIYKCSAYHIDSGAGPGQSGLIDEENIKTRHTTKIASNSVSRREVLIVMSVHRAMRAHILRLSVYGAPCCVSSGDDVVILVSCFPAMESV
jgi:hypothetical protein